MIEIRIRPTQRREWEYYLRRRFECSKKTKLETLIELLVATTVAEQMAKDMAETGKELVEP